MADATPPAATPPATPPVTTPPAVTPPPPPPVTNWMDGFNEDQKGFALNKGYKGPADLLDSYRNLEKLAGAPQDRILKLPEKTDGPEMRAIWERLGAPKEAKDYEIPVAPGADPKDVEAFSNACLKQGMTKQAVKGLLADVQATEQAKATARTAAQAAAFQASEQKLKTDWGAALDQNTNLAKEAARILGFNEQQIQSISQQLGHDGAMKMFHKLSGGIREADFIGGRPVGTGILAPEQARTEIKALMSDREFSKKLSAGDREARSKWDMLHKQAYQGEVHI